MGPKGPPQGAVGRQEPREGLWGGCLGSLGGGTALRWGGDNGVSMGLEGVLLGHLKSPMEGIWGAP